VKTIVRFHREASEDSEVMIGCQAVASCEGEGFVIVVSS